MHLLPFDGTKLGPFGFSDFIDWFYPVGEPTVKAKCPVFYAVVKYKDCKIPVYLKRDTKGDSHQCLLDELKPLFGLAKMGTHLVQLQGQIKKNNMHEPWILKDGTANVSLISKKGYYIIMPAEVQELDNGYKFIPSQAVNITMWKRNVQWSKEEQRLYAQCQRILLFRELFRVVDHYHDNTSVPNILVKQGTNGRYALSINERIVDTYNGTQRYEQYRMRRYIIPENLDTFFFQRIDTKTEVLIDIFGINHKNIHDILSKIKQECENIIERVEPNMLYLSSELHEAIFAYMVRRFDLDVD